jgi:hypothetical protein
MGTIFEEEANDRNSLLIFKHGHIPEYALWRDIDIKHQSLAERFKWWNEQESNQHPIVIEHWKSRLRIKA